MRFGNPTRTFAIERAATIAAIERYEGAMGRVLQAVEDFSDLPEGRALRALEETHAAAEAEWEAADAALHGEIRRLHRNSPSSAVIYGGILYVPITLWPEVDTGARGSKMRILRLLINHDILKLD